MSKTIQQQEAGPSVVVAVPPSQGQEMVLEPLKAEKKSSKFKNFFKKDKKAKIILSERDARILAQVKRRAKVLDTGVDLGFAKIGLDPILGFVPVAGDAITLLMAMRLIHAAQKADIPRELLNKMLFNVAVDFGMGLVPVLGDIADFVFKANDRNAKLFEAFLYERAAAQALAAENAAKTSTSQHHTVPLTGATSINAATGNGQHHHHQASNSSQGHHGSKGHETVVQMDPTTHGTHVK